MPKVRNIHATKVQGRDQRAQAESKDPPSKAAMAKLKATLRPTYPIYSIGGCMVMPKSCNNGFMSLPSTGAGTMRSNGLEVNRMNNSMPMLINAITPKTRASISSLKLRLNKVTAKVHNPKIKAHSNMEPSCAPHTAVMR